MRQIAFIPGHFSSRRGGSLRAHGDASRLDPAVAFVDRFGARQVGRITPLFD